MDIFQIYVSVKLALSVPPFHLSDLLLKLADERIVNL